MHTPKSKEKKLRIINLHPGTASPLQKYEGEFVSTIVQMAKMCKSLSPSESISLIDSMIKCTNAEPELVKWKRKYSSGNDGTICIGYWQAFKKRNAHLIYSKRGQKYELDRNKWTTYTNFDQMYDHVYEAPEDANFAVKLDTPVAQDANGERCNDEDAIGCKVTHNLTHPEIYFVMDEVGGNKSNRRWSYWG